MSASPVESDPIKLKEPIWEKQKGEKTLWYARFLAYLELGVTRSVLQVYKDERIPPNKKGERDKARQGAIKTFPAGWGEISRSWQWQQRAAAYDEHELEERKRAWRARAEEQRQVHHDMGNRLLNQAGEMLDYALSKVEVTGDYEMVFDPVERRRILRESGIDLDDLPETSEGAPLIVVQRTTIQPVRWNKRDAALMAEVGARLQNQAAGVPSQSEVILSGRNKKGETVQLFPISEIRVVAAPPPVIPEDDDAEGAESGPDDVQSQETP